MSIQFVQLSDTHIREPGRLAYRRLDTAPYLQRAVKAILDLPQKPGAVVMTGDLTDFGRIEEYEHLRQLISPLDMPVYLMPGNHDDRDHLRKVFSDHIYLGQTGYVQYEIPVGKILLLALDTTVSGESAGALCSERLQWLSEKLNANRDQRIVVAMHHPPFKTMIGHMDRIGLLSGQAELQSILSGHTNVERVICGHLHRAIDVRFAGTIASTTPSPAHQVSLDLSENGPSSWNLEPPAFRVFGWDENLGIVTHLAYVGPHAGPYPFHENGQLID